MGAHVRDCHPERIPLLPAPLRKPRVIPSLLKLLHRLTALYNG